MDIAPHLPCLEFERSIISLFEGLEEHCLVLKGPLVVLESILYRHLGETTDLVWCLVMEQSLNGSRL